MTDGNQHSENNPATAEDLVSIGETALASGESTVIKGQAEAPVVVSRPAPGEIVNYDPVDGQIVVLDFDPNAAELRIDGGNLIFGFDDNGDGSPDSQIVFLDLASAGADTVTFQVAGVQFGSAELVGGALALAGRDEGGPEVAAGPEATSGGTSVYNDNLGDVIDLLAGQGVIPPVELLFGLTDLEEEITILEEDEAEDVPVPPEAAFTGGVGPQGSLALKEDSTDTVISFLAQVGDETDELTSIVIDLPGVVLGDVDVSQIEADLGLGTAGQLGTVEVTATGGGVTITITFDDAADVEGFDSSFTLDAPEADSDLDLGEATITATAQDKTDPTDTSQATDAAPIEVDAVLDEAGEATQGEEVTGEESAEAQEIGLGLSLGFVNAGFEGSGAGGPDTDGSEEIIDVTVTLDAETLTLGDAAPEGAGLTQNPDGSFTLTVQNPADFGAAIAALQVEVEAGFDGAVNGTISVTTAEIGPNEDGEFDTSDNSKTINNDFTVTVTPGTVDPDTAFDNGIGREIIFDLKEDSTDTVIGFRGSAGDATDELTSIVIDLPGVVPGDVDVSQIEADLGLGTAGQLGTVEVTATGGGVTITIAFNDEAEVELFESSFTLDAPEADSDLDLDDATITTTARDKTNPTDTSQATDAAPIEVDAVLDEAGEATQGEEVTVEESAEAQEIGLGLSLGFVNAGFEGSGAGGPDTDGSEEIIDVTVTLDAETLTLGDAAPEGAGLTQNPDGSFTLTVQDPVDFGAAIAALQVEVEAGFDGAVNGTISVTTEEIEPNEDGEFDTSDNSKTINNDFTVTVTPATGDPETAFTSVDADGKLRLKEDATDTEVNFEAKVGDATDALTSIVIEVPGAEVGGVGIGQIELDLGDNGTVEVTATDGGVTIFIEFNDDADIEAFESNFTLDAPEEDSDRDLGEATITANAQDKTDPTVTSQASDEAPVVVDAVLDQAGVAPQEEEVTVEESAEVQEISLELSLNFVEANFPLSGEGGQDEDGSEQITDVTVTLDAETLTLGDAAPEGAGLTQNPDGSFTLTVQDPADFGAAIAALQVEVESGFDGAVNGTISVTTAEIGPNEDGEFDTSDNSKTINNDFTVTVTPATGDPETAFTSVDADGKLRLKEDATDTEVNFEAKVGDATDALTSIVIEVPGAEVGGVGIGQIELDLGDNGTVEVTATDGGVTIFIEFNDDADIEAFESNFTLDAPEEDSDRDLGEATITANAQDKTDPTVTSQASDEAPVVVDAVLDQAGVAPQEEEVTVEESAEVQEISLELSLNFVEANFPLSGEGGQDEDGSEQITDVTVTLDAETLTLGDAAPEGAGLTQNPDGSFTLTVQDPADFGAAIAALQVEVESGFDGAVNGTISVTTAEIGPNEDGEFDTSDNSKTINNDFTVTVTPATGDPETAFTSVDGEGKLRLKEDATDTEVSFEAKAGDATDELTSIVIDLPGVVLGDVDVSQIEADLGLGTAGQLGTVEVTATGGGVTITIAFNDEAEVELFESSFTLDAPEADSDLDLGEATITATAQDKTDPTDTSQATDAAPIEVDAVLDEAGEATQGEEVTGEESAEAQEIGLGLSLGFVNAGFEGSGAGGPDTDGSEEIIDVTVTLDAETLTLGDAAPEGAGLTQNPDGSFTLTVQDPADFGAAIAALQVEVESGFDGAVNGTISVTTAEIGPNEDGEFDTSDNSKTINNDFTVTVTPATGDPETAFTSVDGEGKLRLKEDATDTEVSFEAKAGDATDELTSIVIDLPGVVLGDVDVSQIEADLGLGTAGQLGTVEVTATGGGVTITIAFNDEAEVELFESSFTLDAPEADSDLDLDDATITTTARDKTNPTDTSQVTDAAPIEVDAVLDEAGEATQGEEVTVEESAEAQEIGLGLSLGFVNAGFEGSGAGGPDTDGSEEIIDVTVTLDAETLTLGDAAPEGAGLTQNPDGSFTLTVQNPADFGAAIAALQVEVEAGFDGAVNGTISVTTAEIEPNEDGEFDTSDNSKTINNDFTVTVTPATGDPETAFTSVDADGKLRLKEDATDTEVNFEAKVGDATDALTSIVIEVPGAEVGGVGIGQIELDLGDNGTVEVTATDGGVTIFIEFNDDADIEAFESNFTLDAPEEDSDRDLGEATITANAQDKTDPTVTSQASDEAPVVVDAVLDQAGVAPQEEEVTVEESAEVQEISLELSLNFVEANFPLSGEGGQDEDGSEQITDVTVTLDAETLTLGDAAPEGAGLTQNPDGSFTLTVQDPADFGAAIAALQVEVEAGFDGAVNGTISVTTAEIGPNEDGEFDTSDNSKTINNDFTVTVTPATGDPETAFTSVDADGNLRLKEDATDTEVNFEAKVGDATDALTSIVIDLPGVVPGDVDAGQIAADLGDNGTVEVTATDEGARITITFNDDADIEAFESNFTLDAPEEDSDRDLGEATITANAQDKTDPETTSQASDEALIVVDAVLDQAGEAKQNETVTVAGATAAQAISLSLVLGFVGPAAADGPDFPLSGAGGADTDGSEQITEVTVTLNTGTLTLGDGAPDGAGLTENPDGSFTLTVQDPADFGEAIAALQVEVEAGFDGAVNGTISVTTAEIVSDGEFDTTDNSQTTTNAFTVTVEEQSDALVVGDTTDDVDGETTPHVVNTSSDDPVSGVITGNEGDDVLIGDVGGEQLAGKVVNLALLLDTSNSLDREINFGGETITRIEALDRSVETLMDNLAAADGATIRVHMVSFAGNNPGVSDTDNGIRGFATFDIIVDGVVNEEALQAAKDFILDGTEDPEEVASGNTNYEAAFNAAVDWFTDDSNTLDNPDINKTVFISDGEPTQSLDDNGEAQGTQNGQPSLDEVLGADGTNEFAALLAEFKGVNGTVDSIGIRVGSSEDNLLDQIDDDGDADNVADGDDLEATMGDLVGVDRLSAVGSDEIIGNEGDDLIFGDTLNTDLLAADQGIDLPPGSSWEVIEVLIDRGFFGDTANMDAVFREVMTFLRDPDIREHFDLAGETIDDNGSGRTGGDDTIEGGAGNDTIYGQEGNDNIDGGADDDLILGGTGNDSVSGGDGADLIDGQEGDDSLNGGAGDDTIVGGAGSDEMAGGDGADIFRWGATDHGQKEVEASESSYNFEGVTQGSGPHSAFTFSVNLVPGEQNEGNGDNLGDMTSILNGLTPAEVRNLSELSDSQYEELANSDNDRFRTVDPDGPSNSIFMAQFTIDEDAEDISEIELKLEAKSDGQNPQAPAHFAVWNYVTESWFPFETAQVGNGQQDGEWIINLTSEFNFDEFLGGEDNNELVVVLINEDTSQEMNIDFLEVNVRAEARDIVTDTVIDFDPAEDKLDLADLLPALGGRATTVEELTDFLQFDLVDGSTIVSIDHNGGGEFEVTLEIVLEGVDLIGEAANDQEVIQGLLDDGILVIGNAAELDSFIGTEGADSIFGGDGADTVDGQGGDDTIDGAADNDVIRGGDGDDHILGGGGADELRGEEGDDVLDGGAGSDSLCGGTGNDSMTGGGGRDDFMWDAGDHGSPENPGGTRAYTFADQAADGSRQHSAFKFVIDAAPGAGTGFPTDLPDLTQVPAGIIPNEINGEDLQEATENQSSFSYRDLEAADGDDFQTDDPAEDVNAGFLAQFTIEENVEAISQISLEIFGRQGTDNDVTEPAHFAVWNYETEQWDLVTSEQSGGPEGGSVEDLFWTINIDSNFDDFLGGEDNDQLTMVWLNQDTGASLRVDSAEVIIESEPGSPDTDAITDFTFDNEVDDPDEDTLDFAGLLDDALSGTESAAELTEYLRFAFDDGSTIVQVDHDGGTTFDPTLEVVLQGVDLSGLGSDQQIIQAMLDGGNLNLDV